MTIRKSCESHRVTQQIISPWQPFQDLNQDFEVSRLTEHLRLRSQQIIIVTVEDSVLRTEMVNLESQEEDARKDVTPKPGWVAITDASVCMRAEERVAGEGAGR